MKTWCVVGACTVNDMQGFAWPSLRHCLCCLHLLHSCTPIPLAPLSLLHSCYLALLQSCTRALSTGTTFQQRVQCMGAEQHGLGFHWRRYSKTFAPPIAANTTTTTPSHRTHHLCNCMSVQAGAGMKENKVQELQMQRACMFKLLL